MIYILEEAKKLFLTGVGAAAMTYDKAMEVVDQLVKKGKLTVDEGRELSEELKREVKGKAETVRVKANEKIEEIKPRTKDEVIKIIKEFNFATKEDIDDIKNRISELEKNITDKQ